MEEKQISQRSIVALNAVLDGLDSRNTVVPSSPDAANAVTIIIAPIAHLPYYFALE